MGKSIRVIVALFFVVTVLWRTSDFYAETKRSTSVTAFGADNDGMTVPLCGSALAKLYPDHYPCLGQDEDGRPDIFVDGKPISEPIPSEPCIESLTLLREIRGLIIKLSEEK
jgi:hypothetical protein